LPGRRSDAPILMHMKTRLIVLIDFSPYSETLLHLANEWGKLLHAHLLIMHQVPGLVPALADRESRRHIIEFEKEKATARLMDLVHNIVSDTLMVTYHVSEKSLLVSLSKILKQRHEDLLLMGLKGTNTLKKLLIGSTVTKVVEYLNHITVAVPVHVGHFIPEKLIVAVSERYPLNEEAFGFMVHSFKGRIVHIEFVAVVAPEEDAKVSSDYLEHLCARYQSEAHSTFKIFKGESAFKEIKAYVQQEQCSMLVVQKGSRSFSDQLFRKFLINELVHDGSMPLIIIPL
jgi:nucleotide-binding universal stress UspA family protein